MTPADARTRRRRLRGRSFLRVLTGWSVIGMTFLDVTSGRTVRGTANRSLGVPGSGLDRRRPALRGGHAEIASGGSPGPRLETGQPPEADALGRRTGQFCCEPQLIAGAHVYARVSMRRPDRSDNNSVT